MKKQGLGQSGRTTAEWSWILYHAPKHTADFKTFLEEFGMRFYCHIFAGQGCLQPMSGFCLFGIGVAQFTHKMGFIAALLPSFLPC